LSLPDESGNYIFMERISLLVLSVVEGLMLHKSSDFDDSIFPSPRRGKGWDEGESSALVSRDHFFPLCSLPIYRQGLFCPMNRATTFLWSASACLS
jgi:hypothetical protein